MKKSDFYYDLPQELIAQTPLEQRDLSRMMYLSRKTGLVEHKKFKDIFSYLKKDDCLILNDSRVIPARLYGVKENGGAVVEFLLLSQKDQNVWEVLTGPGRRAKKGSIFSFSDGKMKCEVIDVLDNGNRLARFEYEGSFFALLDEIGQMPLPHYITSELKDKERYQTVYSRQLGSAAAPTAGLHFTEDTLKRIAENGIKIGYVTLHVGLGTFRPVKADRITDHKMHSECYSMSAETAEIIKRTRENGGRVIAVGTTSCRTIESVMRDNGKICEAEGVTDIFMYPGYQFKATDGLLTNFHLPESTLIMLVSAFAGHEHTMQAYNVAVQEKYRFFSFGDCMLIL